MSVVPSKLFRPSRPDSIETRAQVDKARSNYADCSGLLGRTLLRRVYEFPKFAFKRGELFRPSRPDSIETQKNYETFAYADTDCSGLLGRTLLRQALPKIWT